MDRVDRVADHFRSCKDTLLARWRERVRSDSSLPARRLAFSDRELEDHLPALLDSVIEALERKQTDDKTVRDRAAEHGHTRRLSGYSIEQLIWEFAIFRKLLRETLEQIAHREPRQDLFAARELMLAITDRSQTASIHQYVQETSGERDAAREALREANEQKDRFLAVLSHELRNPLAAIRTAIHIARSGGASFSEAQRQRALEIIDRQADFQSRLVDDLLDINRISQGKIELKRQNIDLRDPVKGAVGTYFPAIESKAIKFQFIGPDREIRAYADPVRIEQIVSNLLSNALRFTRSGGSIEVGLSKAGEIATISVRDSGAGMDPSNLDRLFELFSQGDRGPTEAGLGIGLWLAKRLTEMHGGTIRATSEGLERGTQLVVQLPCLPIKVRGKTNRQKRVLIVEDDPEQRELLLIALSGTDAEISAAKDGSEAVKMAASNRFDVCILDLNLPDISGYDLLDRLLEIHDERRPLTIALTGSGRPEDEARVKAAGFDYHMVKPCDIGLIEQLISQFRKSDEMLF